MTCTSAADAAPAISSATSMDKHRANDFRFIESPPLGARAVLNGSEVYRSHFDAGQYHTAATLGRDVVRRRKHVLVPGHGFRARRFASPRNDDGYAWPASLDSLPRSMPSLRIAA